MNKCIFLCVATILFLVVSCGGGGGGSSSDSLPPTSISNIWDTAEWDNFFWE